MTPTPETDTFRPDHLASLLPDRALDVAQLEAWASGVIAEVDDIDALIEVLVAEAADPAAVALLAAIGAVAEGDAGDRAAGALAGPDGAERPPGSASCGTAQPVEARLILTPDATVVAIGWSHDDGTTHTLLAELVAGTIAAVRFGGGDLFELLDAESGPEPLSIVEIDLDDARGRLEQAAASGSIPSDDETWVNAALARRRFRQLGMVTIPQFEPPPETFPGVEPDAETAGFSAELLQSALRGVWSPDDLGDGDDVVVAELSARVRPLEVSGGNEHEARALRHLEWADWIGAVIGVVRAGPGAPCAPADMVAYVNRCPEISTTIPAAEVEELASCFEVAMGEWDRAGVCEQARLTERGRRVLPQLLLTVADREAAAGSVADS